MCLRNALSVMDLIVKCIRQKHCWTVVRNSMIYIICGNLNNADKTYKLMDRQQKHMYPPSAICLSFLKTTSNLCKRSINLLSEQWIGIICFTYFRASVVTLTLLCPLECWYCVMNCRYPRPPWGIGALCCNICITFVIKLSQISILFSTCMFKK